MATPEAQRSLLLKQVDANMHERLLAILNALFRSPKSKVFSSPVTEKDFPNYTDFIKQPMDLGTVHQRLMADFTEMRPYVMLSRAQCAELGVEYGIPPKVYQLAEEFAHDVRLVFKNCFLAYAADISYHLFKDGHMLLKRFEDLYSEQMGEVEQRSPRVPLRTRCQLLLTDMRRNPFSEWFRRDDWRELGEPYLEALRKLRGAGATGMDLDEVQRRLDGGDYGDAASFDADAYARDMRLIWQNGIDFNGEKTAFGTMLVVLQTTFDRRFGQIRAAKTPVALADEAGLPETRKRRRELVAACAGLSKSAAAEMAKEIEDACPDAVTRQAGASASQPETIDVNLDRVEPASTVGVLLETARGLKATGLVLQ